jgi:hypothetical protein
MKIDWNFIHILEGKAILKGYIPLNKDGTVMGQSGVTIASGFDIGQLTAEGLKSFKFSKTLENKLMPYVNKKKEIALEFLKKNPLSITQGECDEITEKLQNQLSKQLESLYNSHSKIAFSKIPAAAQTVIMSVAYQYGNLPRRTPNFWKVVTSHDWERAVWHLNNFGDKFSVRRKKEAAYLQKHLTTTKK